MALDSLLASLKSGVAEVTEVQAGRNRAFACNPATFAKVAGATGVAAEIHTATPETLAGKSEVAAQSAPIEACTHETSVTPKTIKCEASVTEGNPCGTGDTLTAFRWWLLHYPDRDPVEVVCCPEATHAEILARQPDAVAAEPFTPTLPQPSAPMTGREETAIRAWLALIEETDPATIAEVIGECERNREARDYFTGRAAAELPKPDRFPEDRRRCSQCLNLRGRVCSVAIPGGLVSANRGYQPMRDVLQRCAGYLPDAADNDQRAGHERWPGLIDTK